jgi:FkbM family methyltransferase
MIIQILRIYEKLFNNTYFYKFNKFLFIASSKGLGIDNSELITEKSENALLSYFFSHYNKEEKLIIFDVGANIGEYSAKIKTMNNLVDIYSFEPHPVTFQKLNANSKIVGFNAVQMGCGDQSGTIKFYDYLNSPGTEHATMLKGVIEDIHHSESIEIEVESTTIDDFMQSNLIEHINLLKIDTEGFELNVLKGAEFALNNNKIDMIHFEFNSMNMMSRVFMRDFIKLLSQYKLFRALSNGLVLIDTKHQLLTEIFMFQNIVAIHKSKTNEN